MTKSAISTLIFLALSLCYGMVHAQTRIQQKIYFKFDSYVILKEGSNTLDSLIGVFEKSTNYQIKIAGYTDKVGSLVYNKQLATKRAGVVKRYLLGKGIDSSHFVSVGMGSDLSTIDVVASEQRNASITIDVPDEKTYSFYGKDGTEVISTDEAPLTIKEYFTSESMLRDSMYAVDENNNILETGGMITICRDNGVLDASKKFYIVKMPAKDFVVNNKMRIWLEGEIRSGQTRWSQSGIDLKYDADKKMFIFSIPATTKRC